MRQRKKTKPIAIKKIIDQFLKEYEKNEQSLQSQIIKKWEYIVPKQAAQYTKPVSIKNKTIIIAVSNSAWLHQLTLIKKDILDNIRKTLKTKELINIRFKIGK